MSMLTRLADDIVYGEDGNDTLNAGGPGSELFGGAGDNNLSAAGGGNPLDGEDGADSLIADASNNTQFGGAGDEALLAALLLKGRRWRHGDSGSAPINDKIWRMAS